MRKLILGVAAMLLAPVMALAAEAQSPSPAFDEAPPPPPPSAKAAIDDDGSEVQITTTKEATVAEYRSHGRLYMIKVTPRVGPPYYMVDEEGKGKFRRYDSSGEPRMLPQWILFEF